MAEEPAAGAGRKGYFARRRERRQTSRAARAAAESGRVQPVPPPPPPVPEPRVSLEVIAEVERRIDRMSARERRSALLERYESRYGERLEVPSAFMPVEVVEEEPQIKAAAASGAAPARTEAAPAGRAEAPPAPPPPAPPEMPAAKPPPEAPAPAAPERAPPGQPPEPSTAPAAIVLGRPPEPTPEKPKKPSPINLQSFVKYLWPYWRFPMVALAKYYRPGSRGALAAAAVADALIWVALSLPRLVLCPIGFIETRLRKRKEAKRAEAGEAVPSAH